MRRARAALIACFAWSASVNAAPASAPEADGRDTRVLQEMYGGVVTNQTVTVAGQDFYKSFISLWRDKDMGGRYALAVHERPSARWGSLVWVEYAQKRVFQASLSTSRTNIPALSAQAVEMVYQNVVDTEVQRLFFRDADIGRDEI